MKYKEIANSRQTKDYLSINSIKIDENGQVNVDFRGGGYCGVPWSKQTVFNQKNQAITVKESASFKQSAEMSMLKTVENHQHHHPLYKPTHITENIIDESNQIAAWILFEQIDTDRNNEHGEGWLGDQYRYSLWVKKANKEPENIYSDHAYMRRTTRSGLTGTQGRNCEIKHLRLTDNQLIVQIPQGEKIETQEWVEKKFPI